MKILQKTKKRLKNSRLYRFALLLSEKNLHRLYVRGLYEYTFENGEIIEIYDNSNTRLCRKAPATIEEFENGYKFELAERPVSKIYLAKVKDALLQGGTDGIIKDDQYLLSRYEWDKEGMYVFNPKTVKTMHGNECLLYINRKNAVNAGKCITLINKWASGIFHLTFECLARLQFIENDERYNDWMLVIDEAVRNDSRSVDLIHIINSAGRKIYWIKEGEVLHADEILVLPELAWGTYDLRMLNDEQHAWIIDKRAILYIREKVLHQFQPKHIYKNVYVTRGNNKRVINEDEVAGYFKAHGFEIFNPDDGSFYDEVECFSTAGNIVIGAGSANTNLIYCKKGVRIFSLYPFQYRADCQYIFADPLNLWVKFYALDTVKKGDTMNTAQFRCPIEKCEKIIMEMGAYQNQ